MVIIRSFTTPDQGLQHQQSNVRVVFNDKDIGKGTLYVYESVLGWKDDNRPQSGFCIEYPHISLHALSRDPSSYPVPCIYVMLDARAELPGEGDLNVSNGTHDNKDAENDSDSEADITEIRLIPDDGSSLEPIYHAIGVCQALNPDPNDTSDDDYYDGEDMYGEDEYMEPDADRFESLYINGAGAEIDEDKAFEDAD